GGAAAGRTAAGHGAATGPGLQGIPPALRRARRRCRPARSQEVRGLRRYPRGNPGDDLGHGGRDHGPCGDGRMMVLVFYVALFVIAFAVVGLIRRRRAVHDFTSLKTVTFGDESAISPDRIASVISILAIFLIWGAFTGSRLVPVHVPGPFIGETGFTYVAQNGAGARDEARVSVIVHPLDDVKRPADVARGDGFAGDDSAAV